MKIVDVIPIAKGVFKEKLSYFTSKDAAPGALVEVPMRNKTVLAIVQSVFDAKEAKISLKDSSLSIKPIKSVVAEKFAAPEFLEACKEIAEYYLSTVGSVLKDFAPQIVLEKEFYAAGTGTITEKPAEEMSPLPRPDNIARRHEMALLQSPLKDRIHYYKSIVREEFAKNRSVFLCLPSAAQASAIAEELGKGIEKYSIVLNSKLSKKKIKEEWRRALAETHPVLIVATKSFLSLPRNDFGAIIIDQEYSPFYKNQKQPYVDARKAAEIISRHLKARLIFGGEYLRTETRHREETGEFVPSPVPGSRIESESLQIIADTKEPAESKWQKSKKSLITKWLHGIIGEALAKNEKILIFADRRGHSPMTVCADCQRVITCGKCSAPLTLHKERENSGGAKKQPFYPHTSFITKKTGVGVYLCHKCLSQMPVPEQCPHCGSWRLTTYGAGLQMLAEELGKSYPGLKIFEADSDAVSTDKQGSAIVSEFLTAPSAAALIGTEIIFSYLGKQVDHIAASVDSLFALPEYRINEKIFYLLLKLKSLARKTFIIQTASPENPFFQHALKGNISGFYKEELENRKRFQYPPFKLLIKLTKEDKNDACLAKDAADMEKILAEWRPLNYRAFIPKVKNNYRRHLLLKVDPQNWPKKETKLCQVLSSLPPSWKIDIDPETLL